MKNKKQTNALETAEFIETKRTQMRFSRRALKQVADDRKSDDFTSKQRFCFFSAQLLLLALFSCIAKPVTGLYHASFLIVTYHRVLKLKRARFNYKPQCRLLSATHINKTNRKSPFCLSD